MAKKKKTGPDLEKYLTGDENHYATYVEGADLYSMNYYTFVTHVKKAKANFKFRKEALVNLDIFDAYLEQMRQKGADDHEQAKED